GALAATHNLLTTQDWRDAPLTAIVERELSPYRKEGVTLKGPAVALPPKHALTLTLTLHELATNAAKYGALAQVGGTLDIEWMVSAAGEGRKLTLKWIERGVKIENATAAKEGFGTRLIRSAVAHDLGGKTEYRMRPDGARLTLTCPL